MTEPKTPREIVDNVSRWMGLLTIVICFGSLFLSLFTLNRERDDLEHRLNYCEKRRAIEEDSTTRLMKLYDSMLHGATGVTDPRGVAHEPPQAP